MKKEDILFHINEIDDAYIKEAADFQSAQRRSMQRKKWFRYSSIAAACFLMFVLGAVQLLPSGEQIGNRSSDRNGQNVAAEESDKLPTLSVERYATKAEEPKKKLGNPSTQEDGNPCEEDTEVEFLPVYENIAYAGEADEKAIPVSDAFLDKKLRAAAAEMNMTIDEIKYERKEKSDDTKPEDGTLQKAFKATAYTDDGNITVTYNNFTEIKFAQPKSLPQDYKTADSEMDSEEAEQVTAYLLEQYGGLMEFSNPRVSVRIFYDEERKPHWILSGYDGGENLQEQIVGYNLKRMRFELNDEGQLIGIMMMDNLASGKKIEEYPIITAEEAKQLLKKGKYVAGNTKLPSLDNIERSSLVYLTGPQCNIFMPYYAFDVRIDEDDDLICYSTYYVPAVREEYLSKMPETQE